MLVATQDSGVKRFICAASSSTYGDSKSLPKVEVIIRKPLSPYAITKYVNEFMTLLKNYLSKYDPAITKRDPEYGPECAGDVPHSLPSIDKANKLLGYAPKFDMKSGLREAVKWYWKNL